MPIPYPWFFRDVNEDDVIDFEVHFNDFTSFFQLLSFCVILVARLNLNSGYRGQLMKQYRGMIQEMHEFILNVLKTQY